MSNQPDLRVIELDEGRKVHLGSLSERIEHVIYDYAEEFEVTLAEIVGVLECVKKDLIDEQKEG